jgi:alkaline phosphatase
MIGDGMQLAHEVATSRYLYGTDFGLSFHDFPDRSFATTWDINNYNIRASALGVALYSSKTFVPSVGYDPNIGGNKPYPLLPDNEERRAYFLTAGAYPDSAATATAMSTGIKTYSHAIAWRSDEDGGGPLETSPYLLRRVFGTAIGFVTTVPFSHATPASFFSHEGARDNTVRIARELFMNSRPEVMIGGGWMNPYYYDSADLNDLMVLGKHEFVFRQDGVDGNTAILEAAAKAVQNGKGLVGIFGEGQSAGRTGNFPPPIPRDNPGSPIIDAGSVENPSLTNASLAALKVLSQDKDGFFLLIEQGDIDWGNHDNDFARMIGCVSDLDAAVRAVVSFVDEPDDEVNWSNTTLIVTADHANSYMRLPQPLGAGDLPTQVGSTYPDGDVTYGWGNHTSELVSVYAKGASAKKIHDYESVFPGLRIIDDTSIYRLTIEAARR